MCVRINHSFEGEDVVPLVSATHSTPPLPPGVVITPLTLQDVEAGDGATSVLEDDVAIAEEERDTGWAGATRLFVNQKALQVGSLNQSTVEPHPFPLQERDHLPPAHFTRPHP